MTNCCRLRFLSRREWLGAIVLWVHHWQLEHLSVLWNTWWWQGVTHTHRAWGCWKCTLCVFKPSKCLSTYTSELYLSLQGNTMDQHYFSLDAVRTSTEHTQMKNVWTATHRLTLHVCMDDGGTHETPKAQMIIKREAQFKSHRYRKMREHPSMWTADFSDRRVSHVHAGQDNHRLLLVGDRITDYSWKRQRFVSPTSFWLCKASVSICSQTLTQYILRLTKRTQ